MDGMIWLGRRVNSVYVGTKDKTCCANCEYFYQHYIDVNSDRTFYHDIERDSQTGKRFLPIAWGHCVYKRMKDKNALDSCENFKERR